jgi:membrane protease YdiL (CAAX protease family)
MTRRLVHAPLWIVAAIVPMLASQILRLQQSAPVMWIFWDYAGRFGALAVLGAIPSTRAVAFRAEARRITMWEAAIWIAGIVLVEHFLCGWIQRTVDAALPAMVLGTYPKTTGFLHGLDIVFGLALVAFSEEIIFRRCARDLCVRWLGDGVWMVVVTSLVFGAYHWWTGIGNMGGAALTGVLLMLFYRRSGALWPVVLAHYLTDIVDFAF